MKLLIKLLNNDLYQLLEVTDNSYTCILQGTLVNCLTELKNIIKQQVSDPNTIYIFDATTQTIIDNSGAIPVAVNALSFANS